jgi:hypothetical protein
LLQELGSKVGFFFLCLLTKAVRFRGCLASLVSFSS